MWNLRTVNFDNFWGVKCVVRFHILFFFTCDGLVWFFSGVKNKYQIFINVKNRYQILTRMKNQYQITTSVEKRYQIITYEKLVSKPTRVRNWFQILTHVKNWYQIITEVKNWNSIVTNVSVKTVKNWNRMQNAADLGGILSMWEIGMYAILNMTSCVFFTKCEILVRNMCHIGTNCSRSARNLAPVLHSVK